jgi:hypothetical protein
MPWRRREITDAFVRLDERSEGKVWREAHGEPLEIEHGFTL